MNQILITGEENIEIKKDKKKKEKKVLKINGVVSFFAVSVIILGICMISGSVYAKEKINESIESKVKPQVEINRNDEDNTIEINVKHIRNITKIVYKWNDEDENILYGKNNEKSKEVSKNIDLIGGKNILSVGITEENGQTVTYSKTYNVNIPEIKLEAISDGVKITTTSEEEINYISYSWDDGEEQKITVGEKTYEGTINVPKGEHKLKIEVVDINDMKANKTHTVVGDTEPTLTIKPQYVDGKVAFVINAEDDEKITKVEITHNGGEKQVIDVNDTIYNGNVIMTTGETNTLIVTVTNLTGLTKTSRVKFDNK